MANTWKLSSPSAVLTAVLAAFLVWLAVSALLDPTAAAYRYGASLASTADDTWLYVKAGRDFGLAIMLTTLLVARERRAVGLFVLAACAIPIADFVIVTRHGEHVGYALAVHGSSVLYQVLLGVGLLRHRAGTADRGVIAATPARSY
jgi:hypothetical protein